jgi:FAD binding domain
MNSLLTEHAVVIAGGGPTGMMLAGELALAGVDVAIVERRLSQDLAGLRAGGLHPRTIAVLDQRGIADRFVSQGKMLRKAPFAGAALDISDLPTRHNMPGFPDSACRTFCGRDGMCLRLSDNGRKPLVPMQRFQILIGLDV